MAIRLPKGGRVDASKFFSIKSLCTCTSTGYVYERGMQTTKHPTLSLVDRFKTLEDPRVNRTKEHELVDIMVIAVCTLLCGGGSFNDMADFGHAKREWFETFLGLRNGIPSHDTFNRVFAALDPGKFLECFLAWTQTLRKSVDKEIVAMDGKALRRALNRSEKMKYVVSAWADGNNLVLGQLKVADKSNEITAVPELLRVLELEGCIVTLDAMGCQKEIAKEITEADADYVLALKGNHATIHEEIGDFLNITLEERQSNRVPEKSKSKAAIGLAEKETVDGDHGRIETRRFYQSDHLDWFEDRDKWEGLRSVGMVESIREINGKVQTERRYYLSSLPLGIEDFARAVRCHWGIENKLHWVLDVQLREDESRARTGNAPENLATLRRLALNLLKKDQTKKRGIRGKQLNAGWDHAYLLSLLSF
jgi:predicted transposase YbfD/YdcC